MTFLQRLWHSSRVRRAGRLLQLAKWTVAKRRLPASPASRASNNGGSLPVGDPKEDRFRALIKERRPRRFLEIGIGSSPSVDRIRLLREIGAEYTGCDFAAVCDYHREVLGKQLNGDLTGIRLLGNERGTYAWTLMEMVQRGEQFDVVYLDGHHTFYVDLPAFLLADLLLRPGGTLCVDDLSWTLNFLVGNMTQSLDTWLFYREAYNFDEYTEAQRAMPHIRWIVDEIMVRHRGYRVVEHLRDADWAILEKPVP